MALPFTADQFFTIFAEYNRAFWPVVVAWWLATVAVLALAWRQRERWSPVVSLFLGVLWLWNAVAYHAWLFTRINPAAWMFSALFAVHALLLLRVWRGSRLVYFSATGWRRVLGVTLTVYALAYPFLTVALGHDYPATPTYGVPCPTVILTIGLLLSVHEAPPVSLILIPIAWGFIGGSASVLLDVKTDSVLLAGGVLLLIASATRTAAAHARRAGG